jgi:hypothetical protein
MSYLSVDRNFSSVTGEKQALFWGKFELEATPARKGSEGKKMGQVENNALIHLLVHANLRKKG